MLLPTALAILSSRLTFEFRSHPACSFRSRRFKEAAQRRLNRGKQETIDIQLRTLRDADVIILNEADLGMKRTDYLDVTSELAHALGMNYVFGVEFVEVDRLDDLGVEKVQLEDPALAKQMQQDLKPDPSRCLGLHGNAILSRYPI